MGWAPLNHKSPDVFRDASIKPLQISLESSNQPEYSSQITSSEEFEAETAVLPWIQKHQKFWNREILPGLLKLMGQPESWTSQHKLQVGEKLKYRHHD